MIHNMLGDAFRSNYSPTSIIWTSIIQTSVIRTVEFDKVQGQSTKDKTRVRCAVVYHTAAVRYNSADNVR